MKKIIHLIKRMFIPKTFNPRKSNFFLQDEKGK